MRDMTKRVRTSCLEVAYEDRGSPQAEPVILVHGFPDDIRTWDGVVAPVVDAGYGTHGRRTGSLMTRRSKRPPGPSTTPTSSRYRFTPTAIVGAMRPETIGTTSSKPAWRDYRESASPPQSFTGRMTERPFRRRRRERSG